MELIIKGNWNKIGAGTRIVMMSLSSFIIMAISILRVRWLIDTNLDTIICFFMSGIFLLASFYGKVQLNKKKAYILTAILSLGILEIISGIKLGVLGYISNGIFYIVIPAVLICILENKKQIENIMISVSIGSSAGFMLMFCMSSLFSPLGTEQYESFVFNPNALGMFAAVGFVGAAYLSMKLSSRYKYVTLLIAGLALGFIIFSRSRTAFLVVIAACIVVIYRMILNRKNHNFKTFIMCAISIVLAVYVSYFCITTVTNVIGIYDNMELKKTIEQYLDINLIDKDKLGKEPDVDFGDVLESGAKRGMKGIADDNSFSSGRTMIWKQFMTEITLSGHAKGTIEIEDYDYDAHSAYLQTAYSFGGIAGVVYLIISIYAGSVLFISFIRSIKNKTQSTELAGIYLFFAGFLIYSVLSASVDPISYFFVMEFNLIVIPAIALNNKNGSMNEELVIK